METKELESLVLDHEINEIDDVYGNAHFQRDLISYYQAHKWEEIYNEVQLAEIDGVQEALLSGDSAEVGILVEQAVKSYVLSTFANDRLCKNFHGQYVRGYEQQIMGQGND